MIKPSDMDKIILSYKFRTSANKNNFDYNDVYSLLYKEDKEEFAEFWNDYYKDYYNEELDKIINNRDIEPWEYTYYNLCKNFYEWMTKEPKRNVFRAIKTRFNQDDMLNYITTKAKKVGVCWAFDIEHAMPYFAESKSDKDNFYILEAEVDIFKDVDINYTVYANADTVTSLEAEFECRLIENAPIKLLNIYNMKDKNDKALNIYTYYDVSKYDLLRQKINNKELDITVKA